MPNRILKDSVCTSDNIDMLSAEEEVFWYRLIVQCDDYGRMDARPAILRARCYPLRLDTVDEQDISTWLASLQRAGLIHIYAVNDKPYLQIATWDKHQQVRAKRSKYPPMISDDINCNQVQADAPVIQSNPIQYNPPAGGGDAFAQVCTVYEQNVGLLTKIISEKLADDIATYGAPWVTDAIGIAVTAEKRNLSYVEGILKKWKHEGRTNGNKPVKAEVASEVW
jgi:DnaD/phage-associated family protein